jgi:phosphatidylinositol alpha-1,6-mannosyltransferase
MIVGSFPAFSSTNYGGLEESAWVASQALRSVRGEAAGGGPQFFCYGPQALGDKGLESMAIAHALSRPEALWTVLKHRWRAETILVWHIQLLKLLPLFRLPAAKVVLFLHGIEAWKRQGWLTQRMLQRVDLMLSNSQYTWERFLELHPAVARKSHKVVSLGLGEPLATPTPRPLEDKPVALMLGRMDRREAYKGHREMIEAWPLVVERLPAAELWIVGGGDLLPDLKQIAEQCGVPGHIRFFGRVSPEEKQELLGQCRCLALPSRGEGFGLVYLEAMRLGRPCLVSTEDAGREVVNPPEAGLSASPYQAAELADATCRLLTPGAEWEKFAAGARRRYESGFTAARFQGRLLEALAGLE